ncbi:nuclease domain-containing protein [Pseudocolwellia sp. HL-MZ19]|uniref:nuclease domain-containing protein n=1 Tax=Pseudocolwellia sp. HL-MZ19 TaxID=3400846 RepID=UPI003CEB78A9
MGYRIFDIKSDHEINFLNNEFIIEENKKYKIIDDTGSLKPEEFTTIGDWLSPNLATITSTNKVAVFRLKNIDIRVTSKLGDDFFNKVKTEIAEIEKQLLISSNGLEETLALTHGSFLEDVAISLLLESWNNGELHRVLRFLFENPRFGFFNKSIEKDLTKGDVLSSADFQHLSKSTSSFIAHNGKVIPTTIDTLTRAQTHNVIEMRFIKFFLLFCFNLLEKRIISLEFEITELKQNIYDLKVEGSNNNRVLLLSNTLCALESKQTKNKKIKLNLNIFLRNKALDNVKFTGGIDFTSLKLHNQFHLKYLLNLYLKMRKSFEPLSSDNLVYLDINSLENLYEYYCLIRLLKDFDVPIENIKSLIKKDKSGWIIDKAIPMAIGEYFGFTFTLHFKKNFKSGSGSYSQSYDPDYTIVLAKEGYSESYLHLDAKYKHYKGKVKKDDIDKMHTYTHAIKRSKGSIVLFPGNENVRYDCLSTIVGALFCTPNEPQNLQDSLIKFFE